MFDRVEYTYYADGARATTTDQRGVVHEYLYDDLGRLTEDRVTGLGDSSQAVDGAVRAIVTASVTVVVELGPETLRVLAEVQADLKRLAEHFVWCACPSFDNAPGCHFEAVAGRRILGRVMMSCQLVLDGEVHAFNSLADLAAACSASDPARAPISSWAAGGFAPATRASPTHRKRPWPNYSSSETGERVCRNAMQVFGGYGYSREYPVERMYPDARLMTIGEGTSEIQRLVIARHVLA